MVRLVQPESPNEFLVQLHPTERCNLACRHCYRRERARRELPLSRIGEILSDIAGALDTWRTDYGVDFRPRLQLAGGEPFLRRDIFKLIDLAKKRGFGVSILTNGTLVADSIADALASAGVDLVQISLEGGEATHDAIRGPGAFESAAAAARRLADRGVFVSLNATLSRLNAKEIEEAIDSGRRSGASWMSFSRLVPSGAGIDLADLILEPEELKGIYVYLAARTDPHVEIVSRDPLVGLLEDHDRASTHSGDIAVGGCNAGVAAITVLPDGAAMACRRLGIEIGNILETPFRKLWTESPLLWALRSRDGYRGRCGVCERWAICRGCRAVALALSAKDGRPDPLADDPQCWYDLGARSHKSS